MNSAHPHFPTPYVSVIIPAHNEERHIAKCLHSVLKTGWPREMLELLVIDHSSTDRTAKLAQTAGARVLSLSTGKIGSVRNAGLAAAKGEFVAYVDGDCTVPATWLQAAIGLLQSDQSIGAVGGPCLSPADGTWVERSIVPSAIESGLARRVKAIATSSFIARTSLLRDIGGFDETLISGEDDDMSNRIRSRGLALVSTSDCHIVHHGYPQTWQDMLKKEIWHGSHHIEVRTEFDLTLLLTFLFLLASMAAPVLLVIAALSPGPKSFYALGVSLILQLVPPSLLAAKRLRQSPRDWHLIPQMLAVGYAYFIGHSVGVLANLRRSATSHFQRRAATGPDS
ncbi:MAG: glycosyltransferase family 2 protein [Gammaproteobacteria bacterium]